MGSWECDTGAPSALTDRAENRKRKMFPLSFLNRFCYPCHTKPWDFPIVFGSQIQTVPIRTCTCVYCTEARDMPTSSSILALGYENAFYWKGISHNKPDTMYILVLAPDQYKKKLFSFEQLAFFVFDMCGWYCFPKNKFVHLASAAFAPKPLHVAAV